jgi:type II secretory pathway component PulJ
MNEIVIAAIVLVIVWKIYDSIKQATNPAYRKARRQQNIQMERDTIRREAVAQAHESRRRRQNRPKSKWDY